MADGKCGVPASLTDSLTKYPEESKATKPADTSDGTSWVSVVALLFLSFNCSAAFYHSRHDPWSVAFVAASFFILLALFYSLRVFETLPRGSPKRARVQAAVWVLSTVLTVMFSHRVAALMPLPVAVVVWVMAGSTIFAGFYMFFVYQEELPAEEKPAKVADLA